MSRKSLFIILALFTAFNSVFAQQEERVEQEWKILGLSQTEWERCKQNDIDIKKVKHLLSRGVTVSEYLSKPWITLGISERAWINQREKGLNTEDIQAFQDKSNNGGWIIMSGLIPGYRQFKRKDMLKGTVMSGIGIASLSLYFLDEKVETNELNGEETRTKKSSYLIILLADCIFSVVDVYRNDYPRAARQDIGFNIESNGKETRAEYSFTF